jgi:hypothetical protein
VRAALLAPLVVLIGLAACPRRSADQPSTPDQGRRAVLAVRRLTVGELSFAGPAGLRADATFMPGEVVTCFLSVAGFIHQEGRVELRADLKVTGPEGQVILDQPDLPLLSGKTSTPRPGTVRSAAELRLSRAAPPGRLALSVKVRDLLGGGSGGGRAELTLLGTPAEREDHLQLGNLRWGAGAQTPPGGVLPAVFVVRGLATRKLAASGHQLDLQVRSRISDGGGRTVAERAETLFAGQLSFAPDAFPFEEAVSVPANAAPGAYQVSIEVKDRLSGTRASDHLPLTVVPAKLGLWAIHLRDASGLTRDTYLLGEQTFVRFAVFGMSRQGGRLDLAVDLAIAGPDNGIYLAQPRAAVASGPSSEGFAKAGRFAAQLPLTLPVLAPPGRYRLVLRARDQQARKETIAEQSFVLLGSAPPALADLTITALDVRERPELAPGKGDTFVLGRDYTLELLLGGLQPRAVRKLSWAVAVEGSLQLRNLAGAVVHERKKIFSAKRELGYKPLRLPVRATWRVPELPPGLYDLEVSVLEPGTDRASQLRRRVELIRPSR